MEESVNFPCTIEWDQVNVVSTVTHCGLDGLSFETEGGEIFHTCPDGP
jgi:hypothetical protein